MKTSSSELLRELCSASSKLQEAHAIARRAGRGDLASEIMRTGEAVAGLIGKLVTARPAEVVS